MRPSRLSDHRSPRPSTMSAVPLPNRPIPPDDMPEPLGPPDYSAFLAARERVMARLRPSQGAVAR